MGDVDMIPYKQFMQMQDLQCEYAEHKTRDAQDVLITYQDRIGWPWNASKSQIADWNESMENMV
jgi:hypothetical protein